jgi:Protein of unknown function (DUF998)
MSEHLALPAPTSAVVTAPRRSTRLQTTTAIVAPPLFAVVAVTLTWLQQDSLSRYGWSVLDHAGVPWPSALATGQYGWIQSVAFALLGAGVLALVPGLRSTLRPGPALRIVTAALVVQGVSLLLCAFTLDPPAGAPGELASWVQSWHAVLHVVGFIGTGAAAVIATATLALAARHRPGWRQVVRYSAVCAVALVVSFAASTAPAWYAFLALDLAWVMAVAHRLTPQGDHATS